MPTFTKEQIRQYLNRNSDSANQLATELMREPTDDDIENRRSQINNRSDADNQDIANYFLRNSFDQLDVLKRLQALEGNNTRPFIFYTLSANQSAFSNQNTTVAFDTTGSNSSASALADLGLTLRNGVFTSTKQNNLLSVSYQVLFTAGSSGVRNCGIILGTKSYGRNESSFTGQAVFVSGSATILLNRNDTMLIRTFQTDPASLDILSSGTSLSIRQA